MSKKHDWRHGNIRPFFYNRYISVENGFWWLITHPFSTCRDIFGCLRAAWHRGVWGYDFSDVWSLDAHLALVLPVQLRVLRNGVSYSPYIRMGGKTYWSDGPELWHAMLEFCAVAFEQYYRMHHEMYPFPTIDEMEQATLVVQIALCLLAENYPGLWD